MPPSTESPSHPVACVAETDGSVPEAVRETEEREVLDKECGEEELYVSPVARVAETGGSVPGAMREPEEREVLDKECGEEELNI